MHFGTILGALGLVGLGIKTIIAGDYATGGRLIAEGFAVFGLGHQVSKIPPPTPP